jgi:O-antigen biosynthesis protein
VHSMSNPSHSQRQVLGPPQATTTLRRSANRIAGGTQQPRRLNIFLKVDTPEPEQSFLAGDEIRVTGWLAASEPLADVFVEIGEARYEAARGVHRPDLIDAYPGMPALAHAGFAVSLRVPAPTGNSLGRLELKAIATTVSGSSQTQIIPLLVTVAEKSEFGVRRSEIDSSMHPTVVARSAGDTNPQQAEILLHLDVPAIANGRATKDVTSGLSLSGWALAKGGIDRIDVFVDGAAMGTATRGMSRPDVARAFPAWDGALLSGFGFSLPRRLLKRGAHLVALEAVGRTSARTRTEFQVQVVADDEQEGPSSLRTSLSEAERRLHMEMVPRFEIKPWYVICLRTSGDDSARLLESIRSIATGSYEHWSIAVFCPPDSREPIKDAIGSRFAQLQHRVRFLPSPGQPADCPAEKPLWHIRLEAGDRLAADALFEFTVAINRSPAVDFIYGDDRRYSGEGTTQEAFFKPDWSPDLLLSQNYIGRAFCISDVLLQQCGPNIADAGTYDLVLQGTERAARIAHVRRVVCEHGTLVVSPDDRQALQRAVERRRLDCHVEPGLTACTHRLRPRDAGHGLVSIIIPTCAARGLIEKCLTTIRQKSTYKNIELICIDNIREPSNPWKAWLRQHVDVVIEINEPFNWSRFNNVAAAEASGELLLFLNDDIEIIQPDWLEILLAIARRDDVGAVGPQLLYPDGKVQHAGQFLSKPGLARHAFRFQTADDPGYFDLALSQRDVIAVTGACLMVRRSVFEELSGFEEQHAVINNDLDFCLKCHAAGLLNVYTPFASLIHHELASRAVLKEDHHAGNFASCWDNLFARGDPYFHPYLDHDSDMYAPEAEQVSLVVSGGPHFRAQSIRKILAVKLDHIGDFVAAFPAFRRLKQKFPGASLHVLAAPASRQLAFLEPSIDEMIPFEFFHARSGNGQHELTSEALEALRRELESRDFDLAVDLRKHPETRTLLQLSGARLSAGYDHQNQFPWLDIALEWEGDPVFVTKRQHISGDLVNLVDAVAAAGAEPERIVRRDWPKRQIPLVAQLNRQGLCSRPVVCVHPAAGSELRQWPPAHFAALINLLVEEEGVNAAIVGGPDEAELGDEVMARIRFPDRVVSLVGQLKLDELALFMESCALFVGNNSGPKHIAAALGVPTIGIHSGIVDAKEWGPSGEIAIAIRREMSCGPCYLARRQDCHRDVACLTGMLPDAVFATCQRLLAIRRSSEIS